MRGKLVRFSIVSGNSTGFGNTSQVSRAIPLFIYFTLHTTRLEFLRGWRREIPKLKPELGARANAQQTQDCVDASASSVVARSSVRLAKFSMELGPRKPRSGRSYTQPAQQSAHATGPTYGAGSSTIAAKAVANRLQLTRKRSRKQASEWIIELAGQAKRLAE